MLIRAVLNYIYWADKWSLTRRRNQTIYYTEATVFWVEYVSQRVLGRIRDHNPVHMGKEPFEGGAITLDLFFLFVSL